MRPRKVGRGAKRAALIAAVAAAVALAIGFFASNFAAADVVWTSPVRAVVVGE